VDRQVGEKHGGHVTQFLALDVLAVAKVNEVNLYLARCFQHACKQHTNSSSDTSSSERQCPISELQKSRVFFKKAQPDRFLGFLENTFGDFFCFF